MLKVQLSEKFKFIFAALVFLVRENKFEFGCTTVLLVTNITVEKSSFFHPLPFLNRFKNWTLVISRNKRLYFNLV